ncbi:hypothetical protein JTB14_031241 [Gonioctena quinquepunctata]|nr:hypothetical protein JTB14_031241 [Gonioctena quinquepunctata]
MKELLQVISDSQGNNLELVPLQKMMQDPEYIPALMEYLRRSHQTTRFQSTQTQIFPELLERLSRIQGKRTKGSATRTNDRNDEGRDGKQ